MRMAVFVSIGLWLLLVLAADAGEPALLNAIYRFEIKPSLEKLNLIDKLAGLGTPCSFIRQEPDGSVCRVIVFSDEVANYLATLQMPIVMLTFKNTQSGMIYLAAVQNKQTDGLGGVRLFIRREDQNGKVLQDLR